LQGFIRFLPRDVTVVAHKLCFSVCSHALISGSLTKARRNALKLNFAVAIFYKEAFLLERLSTNSDASALKRKLRLRALAHVTPLRAVTVSEPQLACSLTTKNTMFATICASHGFHESLQRRFSLFLWEVLVYKYLVL
jgi:hypothetical protein